MNRVLVVGAVILGLSPVAGRAVDWPQVTDPRIVYCEPDGVGGKPSPCNMNVRYQIGGTEFIGISPAVPRPPANGSKQVIPYGIHCDSGSITTLSSFSGCGWLNPAANHSPNLIGKCELKSMESWELTDDSTCAVATVYGKHTGAGPGGECVLFAPAGQVPEIGTTSAINTPWGYLDANLVANSGERFCRKAAAPTPGCEVDLDGRIDHGVIAPGEKSVRTIRGSIRCGSAPVARVNRIVSLGKSVKADVFVKIETASTLVVTSSLTTETSTIAGEYFGNTIVTVMPN